MLDGTKPRAAGPIDSPRGRGCTSSEPRKRFYLASLSELIYMSFIIGRLGVSPCAF